MDRFTVIQNIIDKKKANTYLEIGIAHGLVIGRIQAPNIIGVDPKPIITEAIRTRILNDEEHFTIYETTSDVFFNEADDILINGIDVAFVDGLHTYEQALKDVINCLAYLNDDGVIIMHDCNPLNFATAYPAESINEVRALANKGEIPGWNNNWNGDVWKALVHLRLAYDNLHVFTLDLDWGLGIIIKGGGEKLNITVTTDQLRALDYAFLEQNRGTLLNLRDPKYLGEFLSMLK